MSIAERSCFMHHGKDACVIETENEKYRLRLNEKAETTNVQTTVRSDLGLALGFSLDS